VSTGHDSPFNPTERMLRQFAAIWIVFFAGNAAWQELHHHRHVLALVLAILSVTVGPLGVAWPRAIRPIFVGWMALAYPIGWTVSRIVLGTIFYGLFTPLGWVFRMASRDELGLKKQPDAQTYWRSKTCAADKADYLRQF
jgi:hypothetical protein